MKYLFAFSLIVLFFSACEDVREPNLPPDEYNIKNVPVDRKEIPKLKVDTFCFVRFYGPKNLDTMAVRIIINDHDVEGQMMELPFDGINKLGFISGTIEDSIIHAGWVFEENEKKDAMQLAFKLSANQLLQKPNVYNKIIGKFILPESSNFSIPYRKIDCSKFPQHLIRVGM